MSEFRCGEFDGCTENYCGYPGEEECHWLNVPVEGCDCASCQPPPPRGYPDLEKRMRDMMLDWPESAP